MRRNIQILIVLERQIILKLQLQAYTTKVGKDLTKAVRLRLSLIK